MTTAAHSTGARNGVFRESPGGTERAGAAFREALLNAIADNPHLPSPPAVALQVIERASRPNCTPKDLTTLIQVDPGLCGKLLKTVNSALYSLPRAITSVDRAISLLGLGTVRSLVLSLSLPAIQRPSMPGDWMREYWQFSVAGAIIAREVAVLRKRPNAEDELVAGLLRDLGMLVLQQLYPEAYAELLAQSPSAVAAHQCGLEEEAFGLSHAAISAFMLERWRLPREIAEAIRYHHNPADSIGVGREIEERAYLLYFATRIAQLQTHSSSLELCQEVKNLARTRFDLDEEQFTTFLESLHPKIESFASMMNVDIGATANYATLMVSATEELVRLTVANSIDQLRVREEKAKAEQEVQQWQRTAYRLRKDAVRDALTGVYNRGFFEESLVGEFKRCRRRCTIVGLLFLDLDGFKLVNDRQGHAMGDQLLQEVAATLQRNVRETDTVARYGGDEFCIIVPDTTEAGVQSLGERLLAAIRDLRVVRGDQTATVGVSIGGVVCFPRRGNFTYGQFLNAADKAMYSVKTSGKNRVTVVSLVDTKDAQFLVEVQKRLFSEFLLGRGLLGEREMQKARQPASPFYSIGRLARQVGWMSREELQGILREQRQAKQLFGELAVQRGILTQEQVYGLLALQREPPEDLVEALVDQSILSESQAREEMEAYYREVHRVTCLPQRLELQPATAVESM